MKKYLSFILLLLLSIKSFAQLDTEHWFAPMIDRTYAPNNNQSLYFSTNETERFTINIYSNNEKIGEVTIGKNSPTKFDVPRKYIITGLNDDTFNVITLGLYTKADKPYYANLRFAVYDHAGMITSKGRAGIGTKFYAVMAPLSVSDQSLNYMASILATEDNTFVTVSGISNSTSSFTLNKGESYIVEGTRPSYIGAKIISDKNISVTNGNFNGNHSTGFIRVGQDIQIDQSVPVDRLGKEYALIKGRGDIGSTMESGVIVATEDNTQIFFNNETTSALTLDEGEYFLIPETYYERKSNVVSNIYIKATKNIYLYQLFAGNRGRSTTANTGGFYIVPPLNCYTPKTVGEIGDLDESYMTIFNEQTMQPKAVRNNPARVNIITETGAQVRINENLIGANRVYPLTGNNDWVTIMQDGISGNVTISSTKALIAGILTGNARVGYGGYFSGFSSVPAITKKSGECIPDIILEVKGEYVYENYQWFLNGVLIPGATSNTYKPLVGGNYTVKVSSGSCPPIETAKYKLINCTKYTTINKCVANTFIVKPKFSNSSQNVAFNTLRIITQPTKRGTLKLNLSEEYLEYTVIPGSTGSDSFVFKFCGDDEFEDCEEVTVNLDIVDFEIKNTSVTKCRTSANGAIFNLREIDINNNAAVPIIFYKNYVDAEQEIPGTEIQNDTAYESAGEDIYAVIKASANCTLIVKITLALYPDLKFKSNFNATFCNIDPDKPIEIDFAIIRNQILENDSFFDIKFYLNILDANAGNNNVLPENWTFSTNTTVFVRVDSKGGCFTEVKSFNFKVGDKINFKKTIAYDLCDEFLEGNVEIILADYLNLFQLESGVSVTYYDDLDEARIGNPSQQVSANQKITADKTFYYRFSKANFCDGVGTFNINFKSPLKSKILKDKDICPGTTITLDAGSGFLSYAWRSSKEGPVISTDRLLPDVGPGEYFVLLEAPNKCKYLQKVTISEVILPEITAIDIERAKITITATGGNQPYQYSLNGDPYQNSNVFLNVSSGLNTVYVISADNCSPVSKEFLLVNIFNVITPNGDKNNDTFTYLDIQNKKNAKLEVYDRYGSLVFTGSESNNYTWDGTINQRKAATGSYWYVLEWQEEDFDVLLKYSGWVVLKNSN